MTVGEGVSGMESMSNSAIGTILPLPILLLDNIMNREDALLHSWAIYPGTCNCKYEKEMALPRRTAYLQHSVQNEYRIHPSLADYLNTGQFHYPFKCTCGALWVTGKVDYVNRKWLWYRLDDDEYTIC